MRRHMWTVVTGAAITGGVALAVFKLRQIAKHHAPGLGEWIIDQYNSGQMRNIIMQIRLILKMMPSIIRAGWRNCSLDVKEGVLYLQADCENWIARFAPENDTFRVISCRTDDTEWWCADDPRMLGISPDKLSMILQARQ